MKHIVLLSLGIFVAMLGEVAAAEPILTISGTTSSGVVVHIEFSDEEFDDLPRIEVVTGNDYVDEPAKFSGPLLRTVVSDLNLDGSEELVLTALNDYSVDIPASDIFDYDVILATEMNDVKLSQRDKGPIWVIYPMSDHSLLQNAVYGSRLIWQLVKVELK